MAAIKVGDKIPNVKIKTMKDGNMQDVSTADLCKGKKVVLFAVPGAFTPTCSMQHLPGFIENADKLKAKGVDTIACMSVNDAFVMDAWGKDRGAGDKVMMLADGNAEFAKALGLTMDGSGIGFGTRAQRFALIIDNGVVKHTAIEEPMKFDVSAAEKILAAL